MDLTNDVLKEECVELPFSQLHAGRKRYGLLLLHVVICIQYVYTEKRVTLPTDY